jgi:Na+/H+-translocating membrane pyrophosphatase
MLASQAMSQRSECVDVTVNNRVVPACVVRMGAPRMSMCCTLHTHATRAAFRSGAVMGFLLSSLGLLALFLTILVFSKVVF